MAYDLDLNENYYGAGLDEGLSPLEFVNKMKFIIDQWYADEGPEAWKIYLNDDDDEATKN